MANCCSGQGHGIEVLHPECLVVFCAFVQSWTLCISQMVRSLEPCGTIASFGAGDVEGAVSQAAVAVPKEVLRDAEHMQHLVSHTTTDV